MGRAGIGRGAGVCAALGILLLVTWRIGVAPLVDWDEALTGARTLGILETGDWLTVHLNGVPDFHKPPLYYWLAAACAHAIGAGESAIRLPGVVFAVALCGAIASLGAWLAGPVAGVFAALTLASTPMFVAHARQAQPDMVLYAASVAAILAAVRESYWLAAIAVAAAILAKGLAGLLAPLVVVFWFALTGRWRAFVDARLWLGAAVTIALLAPWLAWNSLHHATAFQSTFIGSEVADRIVWTSPFGPTGAYYASVARDALGALPWLALGWPLALAADTRTWRRQALVVAMLVAAVLALAITHPKNAHYVLIPALPLALAAGAFVGQATASKRLALPILLLATMLVATAISAAGFELALPAAVLLLVLLLFAAAAVLACDGMPAARAGAAVFAAALGLGAIANLGDVRADGMPNREIQVLAPAIGEVLPPGETLVVDRTTIQGIVFYARRPVAKLRGFLAGATHLPDSFFGLFESGIERGIAGYRARQHARAGKLGLYELVRKPSSAPDGPRFVSRGDDPRMIGTLRLLGADFAEVRQHEFVNYVVTGRRGSEGKALDRTHWRLAGGGADSDAAAAVDGDPRTSWQMGVADAPAFVLDLGGVYRVTRISLTSDRFDRLPRALSVESSTDAETWQAIVAAAELEPGYRFAALGGGIEYARAPTIEVGFAPRAAKLLRFGLPAGAVHAKWRIAELEVHAD